jgi:hypothetical protein
LSLAGKCFSSPGAILNVFRGFLPRFFAIVFIPTNVHLKILIKKLAYIKFLFTFVLMNTITHNNKEYFIVIDNNEIQLQSTTEDIIIPFDELDKEAQNATDTIEFDEDGPYRADNEREYSEYIDDNVVEYVERKLKAGEYQVISWDVN